MILLTLAGMATTRPALSVTDATATAVGTSVGASVGATGAVVATGAGVAVGACAGAVAQELMSRPTLNKTIRNNDFMEIPFK
jgi:outer membrane lipoprotein SlyB